MKILRKKSRRSRGNKVMFWLLFAVGVLVTCEQARAFSPEERLRRWQNVWKGSDSFRESHGGLDTPWKDLTPDQRLERAENWEKEKQKIRDIEEEFKDEGIALPFIPYHDPGIVLVDGFSPLFDTNPFDDEFGSLVTLTFAFSDLLTGLPIGHDGVASVLYESYTGGVFETIGTSTDAASGFGLTARIMGFEPIIEGIPFDAAGNPIFVEGVEGQNMAPGLAMLIPRAAPDNGTSLALLCISFGALGFLRRNLNSVPSR